MLLLAPYGRSTANINTGSGLAENQGWESRIEDQGSLILDPASQETILESTL